MSTTTFDPQMSTFPSATDPIPVGHFALSAIIDRIRSSDLAAITNRIATDFAAAGGGKAGKQATAASKKRLPAVTLAGTFLRRANDSWREPSGLVQIDLDNMTAAEMAAVRSKLVACPWLACLWTSPSGAGLKGAVRVPGLVTTEPAAYTAAWRAVTRRLASMGLENDPAAKDCSRIAFLAHDPDAWFNPAAVPLDLDQWAEPTPAATPPPFTSERIPGAESGVSVERRALAYVRAMPPSVEGENGSAALMAVVRVLRDGFDLSESALWRVLDNWNTEQADPPWNRRELEHALESVEKEPSTYGRGFLLGDSVNHDAASPGAWQTPVPIGRAATPPPFASADMLPADVPELIALVEALAEAVQVPVELAASGAVGLAALACSRAVEVECASDWREPAPLWVLPLLRPGERKSASLGMLTRPFHDWMAKERARLGAPVARFMERRRTMEARLASVRSCAAKATDLAKRAALEREGSDLAAALDAMPVRLAAPDLLVQSFTPEGMRDALEANGEKMGIVSAESDAAELMGSRYNDAGSDISLLLSAHAGDPINTRRAGGRVVPLERPAVGMVLAVQPEAVRTVLGDRAAKGRGLVDRMLLILPPSRMGSRSLDPAPVPVSVSGWWAGIIGRLLDLPWPGRCIVGGDGEPVRCSPPSRILTIDPEARRILWALRADLEARLAEGADLASCSGFASKLPGACARIALAFTMLRDPVAVTVGAEAMRAACGWAPFLLAHHRAVLGDAAEKPEAHHARRLWKALRRRGRATMSGRDLFKLVLDSALPDMEAFAPVLALLVEHGAVRSAAGKRARARRPAAMYEVHPDLLPEGVSSDTSDISREGIGGQTAKVSDLSDNFLEDCPSGEGWSGDRSRWDLLPICPTLSDVFSN